MSTLTYRTEARDAYLTATTARTTVLDQLNDIRRDDKALAVAGVSSDEVRAAFETVWAVAAFYERQLFVDANAERKVNDQVTEELLHRVFSPAAPVPARDAVQAGE